MVEKSNFGKVNVEDLKKLGKGALIAGAGAVLLYIGQGAANLDFGAYTPIATAVCAVIINFGRKLGSKPAA